MAATTSPHDELRVAAVQYKARRPDVYASRAALVDLGHSAAEGAHLVVMPEMAATGYVFPDAEAVRRVAEPARGPTYEALAQVAARHGAWVVAGFPEREAERLYNSALIIDAEGNLAGVYRKTLLYAADRPWATPGDGSYACYQVGPARVAVGICMDLNDERFVGWLGRERPDVLAFPTNWVEEGDDVWSYWAWRMLGLESTLVAANTWGEEPPVAFSGRSAVLRQRVLLAAAAARGDAVLRARVPLARPEGQ